MNGKEYHARTGQQMDAAVYISLAAIPNLDMRTLSSKHVIERIDVEQLNSR